MPGFELSATKRSCELFNNAAKTKKTFVYRISIEKAEKGELKIILDGLPPVMLSSSSTHKTIDLAVTSRLFVECVGEGAVTGSYEFLGCG